MVERVLFRRPDARLIVPLPIEIPEYLQDFETEESRAHFFSLLHQAVKVIPPLKGSTRVSGYWTAGKYMLDHSDVLIALWDGQDAQGKGGTGEMVALARQRGVPLVWVKCGNRRTETHELTSFEVDQGSVMFERF